MLKYAKNKNLLAVLHGCETWSLTLWEKQGLRVFYNRVMRRFGPKTDDVIREWRKLHNEKFHNLCSSPSINRIIK
jgi:hypothetical protein